MDIKYMIEILPRFISVIPVTALIITAAAVLGLILSIAVTIVRLKKIPVLSTLAEIYISFSRSIPILLQLFLFYFGLPVLFQQFGINVTAVEAVFAAVLCLIIYNGAYMSEILRPAFLSLDRGQMEAADSLGYTPFQKFRKIILPQVTPVALPGIGNAVIHLIHDSSLVFAIGVVDIMGLANIIGAESYGLYQLEVFLAVALIYWVISMISEQIIKYLENRRSKSISYHQNTVNEEAN
ncbi:amino acid ABC transporter permease [Corticicoccus populi]|uniref:Amino acid ABC transporter permease n=1 Tax=Corticicoccus populi TaxID=1812821 RepID=A0ABW5WVZ4_9STAP